METALGAALFFGAFGTMEGLAFLVHKYVMHGALWSLHESHHRARDGRFERNDLFAVFFAVFPVLFFVLGLSVSWPFFWVGLGMTGYGLVYFLFHDVIVHQRIAFRRYPRFPYLRRIIQAHRMHHACGARDGCISFGFLYAPPVCVLKSRLTSQV